MYVPVSERLPATGEGAQGYPESTCLSAVAFPALKAAKMELFHMFALF
jgi:hypothetical protein